MVSASDDFSRFCVWKNAALLPGNAYNCNLIDGASIGPGGIEMANGRGAATLRTALQSDQEELKFYQGGLIDTSRAASIGPGGIEI